MYFNGTFSETRTLKQALWRFRQHRQLRFPHSIRPGTLFIACAALRALYRDESLLAVCDAPIEKRSRDILSPATRSPAAKSEETAQWKCGDNAQNFNYLSETFRKSKQRKVHVHANCNRDRSSTSSDTR